MAYYVYRHEGGMIIKKDGPFETKEKAQERASELNRKINIPCGGFKAHKEGEA